MEDRRAYVNENQCERVGKTLSRIKIRPEFYKRDFLEISSDRETKLRMYFFAVAICHQTHQLQNSDSSIFGWDYMEKVFLRIMQKYTAFINPGYLTVIGEAQTAEYLAWLFGPKDKPYLCTLDRLQERAKLLIETAKLLRDKHSGSVSRMLDSGKGYLLRDGSGIYEILGEFKAYSDPHRKKSSFFLKLATEAGLIHINDQGNMAPIMDYHMQRVLLRTGCVEIDDNNLRLKLTGRETLETDEPVRSASIMAVKLIAGISGHPLWRLNDFLWALGRSCCKDTFLCMDKQCEKEPCTLFAIADLEAHDHCIFEEVCLGYGSEEYRKLWHPVVDTDYY
ncbi:MAG: hypothetical protein JXA03_05510 [Bacteroidales bacterium]|nr:hypothetical protein [Bacteroidales bacterium]